MYEILCLLYEIKKKVPRTQRLSKTSVSKTQYFINPLQANEVSAVWDHAATSLILAARESLALMMRPRCHKSVCIENLSVVKDALDGRQSSAHKETYLFFGFSNPLLQPFNPLVGNISA